MSSDAQLDAALDLLRRLSPLRTSSTISQITTLSPQIEDDLLASVDQPLLLARDPSTTRDYLLCDYNRDGNSYRSPWSNKFYPPVTGDDADGLIYPSERVRRMEVEMNAGFDVYRQMYYEGGVGSVYLWDGEVGTGFAGVVLLKKGDSGQSAQTNTQTNGKGSGSGKGADTAGWDSIHVVEVDERSQTSKSAHYKLTSTVILHLGREEERVGELSLAGSLTRQEERDLGVESLGALGRDGGHVVNIGRLVEEAEGKMRNLLQEVYFGKARDVVGDLRSVQSLSGVERERGMQRDVVKSMSGR